MRFFARNKSLNGFWARKSIFHVPLAGITEFKAEDGVEAKDRNR